MKLDPGFPSHWKTERLIDSLGADGVVAILRLWGKCQIRREWKGLNLTPKRLAMETKWKGDENHLFDTLTDPEAAWLDLAEDGTYSLHGWEEHQKQVIHLWAAGAKGGRPKKDDADSKDKEDSSSYSSSYPICESNGNHMVSKPEKKQLESDSYPEIIEILWKIFPAKSRNRSSKHKLHDALKKTRPKPADETLIEFARKWSSCHEWMKDGGQFAPGAHIWVKDRKWESEPETVNGSTPPKQIQFID